jgi:hypothetical protein
MSKPVVHFGGMDLKLLHAYDNFIGKYIENLLLEAVECEELLMQPTKLSPFAVRVAARMSRERKELLAQFQQEYCSAPAIIYQE